MKMIVSVSALRFKEKEKETLSTIQHKINRTTHHFYDLGNPALNHHCKTLCPRGKQANLYSNFDLQFKA